MAAMWSVLLYTGFTVAAFYFFLLRPVLQQKKEQRKAVRELRIGDEVATRGGLIAEVKEIITPAEGPVEVILEIAPGVRVRALTEAIERRLTTIADHESAGPERADSDAILEEAQQSS